jgi:two-component system cell cycle response regulator
MTGQLKALMARMAQGGEPVATLLIDMDHFKSINDTYGHAAGDEVLKEFALRLATSVRAIDVLCRYGGEEFVVVMPDTQQEDACRIAERIRLHVAGAPFRIHGGRDTISATISIGVASSHDPEDTLEALLQRADEALYEAKSGGRNRVVTARAA